MAAQVQAQGNVERIESLAVDVWPEYDRASVLVLLTAFLPADAALPATITVPLPEEADLNAVARIGDDGRLFADIDFDDSVPGQVTLTTTDPRFRVEYYMPYEQEGETRTFSFDWEADVDVTELLISVQQPVGTADLTIDPDAFSTTPRQDGFQYHNLSPVTVPAGEAFSVAVEYSRSMDQLSVELLEPESETAVSPDTTTGGQGEGETAAAPGDGQPPNWPTILLASAGVAILAVGAWMLFGERLMAARPFGRLRERERERERETADSDPPAYVQFCHHCGQKSDPRDRFCRSCGTRLRTQESA